MTTTSHPAPADEQSLLDRPGWRVAARTGVLVLLVAGLALGPVGLWQPASARTAPDHDVTRVLR